MSAIGPMNQGKSREEAEEEARKALLQARLQKEKNFDKSPFDLSGGQKKRVAIAGVLAMNPKILILDEPTAGLDPKGRDEILDQIAELHKARGITIIAGFTQHGRHCEICRTSDSGKSR